MDTTVECLNILSKTLIPPIRYKDDDTQFFYPPCEINVGDYYGDSTSKDLFLYVHVNVVKHFRKDVKKILAPNGKAIVHFGESLRQAFPLTRRAEKDPVITVQVCPTSL